MSNFLDVNKVRGSVNFGGWRLDVDGDGRAGRRKARVVSTIPLRKQEPHHHDGTFLIPVTFYTLSTIFDNISSPLCLLSLPHPQHTSPLPTHQPTTAENLGQNSQHVSIPNPHGLIHVTQPRHSLSFGLQDLRPNSKRAETLHVREALFGSHRQMLTMVAG